MSDGFEKYRDGLEIDKTNLDKELSRQAATYLYVTEKSIEAEARYETFKVQVAQLRATLDGEIRKNADLTKAKITEAGILSKIELDENYIAALRTLVALRTQRELSKAMREAYYMRKDMLIQLAIKTRSEIESMLAETMKLKAA